MGLCKKDLPSLKKAKNFSAAAYADFAKKYKGYFIYTVRDVSNEFRSRVLCEGAAITTFKKENTLLIFSKNDLIDFFNDMKRDWIQYDDVPDLGEVPIEFYDFDLSIDDYTPTSLRACGYSPGSSTAKFYFE